MYFVQASAQALYGVGYVIPFALEYEANRLSCGLRDFDEAFEEFAFIERPAEGTPIALLTYYTTKLNHEIKRKVGCIVSNCFISFKDFSWGDAVLTRLEPGQSF